MLQNRWQLLGADIEKMRNEYYERSFGKNHQLIVNIWSEVHQITSAGKFNLTMNIDQMNQKSLETLKVLQNALMKFNYENYLKKFDDLHPIQYQYKREFTTSIDAHKKNIGALETIWVWLEPELAKHKQIVTEMIGTRDKLANAFNDYVKVINSIFSDYDSESDSDSEDELVDDDEFSELIKSCSTNANREALSYIEKILIALAQISYTVDLIYEEHTTGEYIPLVRLYYKIENDVEISVPSLSMFTKLEETKQFLFNNIWNVSKLIDSIATNQFKTSIKRLRDVRRGAPMNINQSKVTALKTISEQVDVISAQFETYKTNLTVEKLKAGLKKFASKTAKAHSRSPMLIHKQISTSVDNFFQTVIAREYNKLIGTLSELKSTVAVTARSQNKVSRIIPIIFQLTEGQNLMPAPKIRKLRRPAKWSKEFNLTEFETLFDGKLKLYDETSVTYRILQKVKKWHNDDLKILRIIDSAVLNIKENRMLLPFQQFKSLDGLQFPDDDSFSMINDNRNELLNALEHLVDVMRSICFGEHFYKLQNFFVMIKDSSRRPLIGEKFIDIDAGDLTKCTRNRETIKEIISISQNKQHNIGIIEAHYRWFQSKIDLFKMDQRTFRKVINDEMDTKFESMDNEFNKLIEKIDNFTDSDLEKHYLANRNYVQRIIDDLSSLPTPAPPKVDPRRGLRRVRHKRLISGSVPTLPPINESD